MSVSQPNGCMTTEPLPKQDESQLLCDSQSIAVNSSGNRNNSFIHLLLKIFYSFPTLFYVNYTERLWVVEVMDWTLDSVPAHYHSDTSIYRINRAGAGKKAPTRSREVFADPVPQAGRRTIGASLHSGVLAIDALTPIGRGQCARSARSGEQGTLEVR